MEKTTKGLELVSQVLLRFSFVCAFFSIVCISFNAFPYGPVEALYPERPAYLASLAGMGCHLASLQWTRQVRRHRILLLLVGAFLVYGLAVTLAGALQWDAPGMLPVLLFQYVKRKAVPTLYILWLAFLLSPLPKEKARGFFMAALLCMFIPNAVHMILEMAANAGWFDVRNFLVGINPFFRKEYTSYGLWPPAYYENRVRGLFAEPSHLAYSLTPVLAFFFYKLRERFAYAFVLFFAAFAFVGKIPTVTGILSFVCLAFSSFAHMLLAKPGGRAALLISAALALSMTLALAVVVEKGHYARLADELRTVERIADYCRQARQNRATPPPELDSKEFSRFFTRLVSLRLELDIALQHPWGTGFYLSGLYWRPLLAWPANKAEVFVWVQEAYSNPVPVIPQLCEFTALLAEFGFPGLALFLLLCAFIARRAWQRYTTENDVFVLYMLFALPAFLLTLAAFALKSGFMMYYFLGFLYAASQHRNSPEYCGDSHAAGKNFS